MSYFSAKNAAIIADIIQYHDAICRNDLSTGYLVSERDYVSAFCTHTRYPEGSFKSRKLSSSVLKRPNYFLPFESLTLPPYYESKFGCDGIILFSGYPESDVKQAVNDVDKQSVNVKKYKVGLFEAKWPRMFGGLKFPSLASKSYQPWDKLDKKGEPHFSTQLIRQSAIGGSGIVMWEQFFSEEQVGSSSGLFDPIGSTCVFHKDALRHMHGDARLNPGNSSKPNGAWGRRDLRALLASKKSYSLRHIIHEMAICNLGILFGAVNNELVIPRKATQLDLDVVKQPIGDSEPLTIPILAGAESHEKIYKFMKDNGLRSYTHIDFNEVDLRKQTLKMISRQTKKDEKKNRVEGDII